VCTILASVLFKMGHFHINKLLNMFSVTFLLNDYRQRNDIAVFTEKNICQKVLGNIIHCLNESDPSQSRSVDIKHK